MRHRKSSLTLDRKRSARKALVRHLVTSMILAERMTTTEAKAKALRPIVERLVTRAKQQTLASRRIVRKSLTTEAATTKLFTVLAPRYAQRRGGYTRLLKMGTRVGDGARRARLEFVQ